MDKYIIRECSPESADFSWYFDGDCYNENSGDYNNTVFIVCREHGRIYGYNIDEYKRIIERAEGVSEGFYDVEHKESAWTSYETYKSVMEDYSIQYTSHKCHLLKEWYNGGGEVDDAESIAQFLTITTGKTWTVQAVYGYCQGDYAEVVYCAYNYKQESAKALGEVWLGCAKEFGVIDLDENGEEIDSCYGYIVADCEARDDSDYKRLVCEWAGIKPDETRFEMIDGYHTYTKYDYRIA